MFEGKPPLASVTHLDIGTTLERVGPMPWRMKANLFLLTPIPLITCDVCVCVCVCVGVCVRV